MRRKAAMSRVSCHVAVRLCGLLAGAWLLQTAATAAAQREIANGSAAGGPPPGASAQSDAGDVPTRRYRLQQGDTFELVFPYITGFNQTVTVQRDGYVSLRIVGDVRAVGLTVPELAQTLRERYAGTMRDPVLTVELRDFEKPYFVAAGEVERPGKYDLRGDTTLMQALAIAGGFTNRAKRTQVVVFRRGPDGPRAVQVQEIDAMKVLEGRDPVEDVRLEPGDLVFVSKTRVDMNTFTSNVLPNLGWLVYLLR
jgi:polysaccharide biosynthesis/export protein